MIVPRRIQDGLQTELIGKEIHHFAGVTSTNDVAKKLAVEGAEEGTVVIAETQTDGRGRVGRGWFSPRGGVWFSTILRPKVSPEDALKLTLTTAVAVARVIRKTLRLNSEIKWPNDVLIEGKKVCGILTEMSTSGKVVDFVILGVGINANVNIDSFPAHLRNSVTSLKKELRQEVPRERFLQALLEEFELYYKMFTRNEFDLILEEWRDLAKFLGSYVEIVSCGEKLVGLAVDVDQSGALLIKTRDGNVRRVVSGDVSLQKL
jgi:BirA family biotin operon repressor/biotin-[acetyl-CoA-carboxylase] ligase